MEAHAGRHPHPSRRKSAVRLIASRAPATSIPGAFRCLRMTRSEVAMCSGVDAAFLAGDLAMAALMRRRIEPPLKRRGGKPPVPMDT